MNKLYMNILIAIITLGSYFSYANELQERIDPKNEISKKMLQNYKESVLMDLQAIQTFTLECTEFRPDNEIGFILSNDSTISNWKSYFTTMIEKSQKGFLSNQGEQPVLVFKNANSNLEFVEYISIKTTSDDKSILEIIFYGYLNEKILTTDFRNPQFQNQYKLQRVVPCQIRFEQHYQNYMKKLN